MPAQSASRDDSPIEGVIETLEPHAKVVRASVVVSAFLFVIFSIFHATQVSALTGWDYIGIGNTQGGFAKQVADGDFYITANGSDIWWNDDSFSYLNKQVSGDFQLTVQVESLTNINDWAKVGLMVRKSTDPGSEHLFIMTTPNTSPNGINFQGRLVQDGTSWQFRQHNTSSFPRWLRIEREGSKYIVYYSTDGQNYVEFGSKNVNLGSNPYVGIAVTSHYPGGFTAAHVNDLYITALTPPPPVGNPDLTIVNKIGGTNPKITGPTQVTVGQPATYEARTINIGEVKAPTSYTRAEASDSNTGRKDYSVGSVAPGGYYIHSYPTSWATAGTYQVKFTADVGGDTADDNPTNNSKTINVTVVEAEPPPLPPDSGTIQPLSDIVDIGNSGTGSVTGYGSGAMDIIGGGADIWGTSDSFRYVYTNKSGNYEIVTRLDSLENVDSWTKAGLMIRANTAANSPYVFVFKTPETGAFFQYRDSAGIFSGIGGGNIGSFAKGFPKYLKLVKNGNEYSALLSLDGSSYVNLGPSRQVDLGQNPIVGLAVTAHKSGDYATAKFSNVGFATIAAPPQLSPEITKFNYDSHTFSGNAIDVNWEAINATTCTATSIPASLWSGTKPVKAFERFTYSGNEAQISISLTCANSFGQSDSTGFKNIIVNPTCTSNGSGPLKNGYLYQRNSSPEVYVIENCVKRWIVSTSVFNACNYDVTNIEYVEDYLLNGLTSGSNVNSPPCPDGPQLPQCIGSLVFSLAAGTSIINGQGQKHVVTAGSPLKFTASGMSNCDGKIVKVNYVKDYSDWSELVRCTFINGKCETNFNTPTTPGLFTILARMDTAGNGSFDKDSSFYMFLELTAPVSSCTGTPMFLLKTGTTTINGKNQTLTVTKGTSIRAEIHGMSNCNGKIGKLMIWENNWNEYQVKNLVGDNWASEFPVNKDPATYITKVTVDKDSDGVDEGGEDSYWMNLKVTVPTTQPPPGGYPLGFDIDIRDTSVQVANRDIVLNRSDALAHYGSLEALSNKLDDVINASIAHGWNPAWIVALWVHETGAGNSIGYLPCRDWDIMQNLNCFFNDSLYTNMTDLYTFIDWWCGPNLPDICYDPVHFAVSPDFIPEMRQMYNYTVAPGDRVDNNRLRLAFFKDEEN